MLSINNIKMIIFAKHSVWKISVDNTVRHLRICRNRHKLIQVSNYSVKCDTKENYVKSLDPRVEALREKLIYCDYLDYQKVKVNYMKRFLSKKRTEYAKKKAQIDWLTNTPVYSVLLDARNDKNDDSHLEQEHVNAEEDEKPVHMPYASTDSYSNMDISLNQSNENNLDKNTVLLNDKYKTLYEEYLTKKNAALEKGELTLLNYLEEMDTDVSYKKDPQSNVPHNWMVDVEQYDDTLYQDDILLNDYGTPDPNSRISSVPCGGCGALLHCKDQALPGYLPSELFRKRSKQELRVMICQRCHFMRYYNTTLEVKVSADEYPKLLKVIKTKKCAVILMVDLTDFPCSIWPEINTVLNPSTPVFVVGNKVDLLPQDSRDFFIHVKNCLSKAVENTGIKKENIGHVALVSAKTGYGIEELINKLHSIWKYKGDVYVIGCTNVGKSSLFNALLQSDYCKVQAVDLIQRATISPWPGTTLNLLKFPILNPLNWRLYLRTLRLRMEQQYKHAEEKVRINQFKATRNLKYATLQSHIGRTFQAKSEIKVENDLIMERKYKHMQQFGFDENREEYKHGRWCYDTPGTIQPDQVLDLLTMQELLSVLPRRIISPRTFVLNVNQTIFLGGIGRLDYVEGNHFIRCTIFSSNELPVTLTCTEDANNVYNELLKTEAFVVPENSPDRLKYWPALESKEMEVTGLGKNESVADVVLSSAGWIAIAAEETEHVSLKAWTPQGRGLHLRTPALLKKSVTLRGNRISDTPTYKSGWQAYKK